jgi:hypothetical protein
MRISVTSTSIPEKTNCHTASLFLLSRISSFVEGYSVKEGLVMTNWILDWTDLPRRNRVPFLDVQTCARR